MMDARICLIGMGNVGSHFLQLLLSKKEDLKKDYDLECIVTAICEYDGALINENGLDLEEIIKKEDSFRELSDWKENVKALDLIPKLNINICIETTPTNPDTGEPALSHIITALKNKINVIASNKGPFYLEYKKIQELAKQNNVLIKYEATVASCVPILSVREGMRGNEILGIKAILNGTSNYILSRMSAEGVPFAIALKEAQELGYAEADPTLDIGGYDAAGKLVILANEWLGSLKTIKDVKTTGISNITPEALELVKADGYVIKHLAIADEKELIVEPRLIKRTSPLNLSGTLNVIELQTKHAGPIILIGRGAGGFEAASAILNDLISIATNKLN